MNNQFEKRINNLDTSKDFNILNKYYLIKILMKYNYRNNAEELHKWYEKWYSCTEIWKMFNTSRQWVWEKLKNAWYELRKNKTLPFIIYDWLKFTIYKQGYYRQTDKRDECILLHRYIYEKHYWEIEDWYEIHHIDLDKLNNNIDNLQKLSKSEHSTLHRKLEKQWKK